MAFIIGQHRRKCTNGMTVAEANNAYLLEKARELSNIATLAILKMKGGFRVGNQKTAFSTSLTQAERTEVAAAQRSSGAKAASSASSKGAGEISKVEANANAGSYLAKKALYQVTPGTRELSGTYVDDIGRVQPWKAYYDKYGRIIGRTDYNAGNKQQGIPDTHYHRYEWGPGKTPHESESHVKGEFKQ